MPPSPRTGRRSASASSRPKPGRKLFRFDRALGFRYVCGADEAGRGCLAGPLVVAAVRFDYARIGPVECRLLAALDDSKAHSQAGREELYGLVLRVADAVAVTSRSARTIDERGLHKTNLAALREMLAAVGCEGAVRLSDGFPVGPSSPEQRAVVGGDRTSAAIAAASIVAKVTRDRFMRRVAAQHPHWGFEGHVGYSCPEHRAAIEAHGISPLHRLSFQSVAYQQLEL